MKRFILLAVCAVALFGAIPSQAACVIAEDVRACSDTDATSYSCSHVYAVVTFAQSCAYMDNGFLGYHYAEVWGDDYWVELWGYPGYRHLYGGVGSECVHVYEATAPDPDFDAGLC